MMTVGYGQYRPYWLPIWEKHDNRINCAQFKDYVAQKSLYLQNTDCENHTAPSNTIQDFLPLLYHSTYPPIHTKYNTLIPHYCPPLEKFYNPPSKNKKIKKFYNPNANLCHQIQTLNFMYGRLPFKWFMIAIVVETPEIKAYFNNEEPTLELLGGVEINSSHFHGMCKMNWILTMKSPTWIIKTCHITYKL